MPGITKARYLEIANTAAQIVTEAGNPNIDDLEPAEQIQHMRDMADVLAEREDIHTKTARRHIVRAIRGAHLRGWGGARDGAGAPKGNRNARKDS